MEKLIRNRFEKAVQDVTDNNKEYLQEEFKAILESNRPYQTKCDYIGYSINSIDDKVSLLDDEIKQLQNYKKRLKVAKEITAEIGADVFTEYGISKIEGLGFSSITITKAISATKLEVTVDNEEILINQGFYKKVIDEKKILKFYMENKHKDLIDSCATFTPITTIKPSKLRINKRKVVNNDNYVSDELQKDVS